MSPRKRKTGRRVLHRVRKPKPKSKTFVSFLLDETSSMGMVRDATISSFNEYIESLAKKASDECRVTLVSFNSDGTKRRSIAVPPAKVEKLTKENYVPAAITPLYDAIWDLLQDTDTALAGQEADVVFVIQTDGQENASRRRTRDEIFREIEARKKKGWAFVFLGANQDAYHAAQLVGIDRGSTLSYQNTNSGTQVTASTLADATMRYRTSTPTAKASLSVRFFKEDEQTKVESTK